jgi:LuxR family transcriptional regulator, maltose regulon positive regulatory protein
MTSAPVRDPLADHLITPQNSAFLFIDYQPNQLATIRSMDPALLLKNAVSTIRAIKTFGVPVVHSTVNVANGQGSTLPELAGLLADDKPLDRTTVNSWEDVEFLQAVRATGRRKLIICALWTEVCMAFTALDALRDGYEVYPVVDAIAGTSPESHRAGLERVTQAGGQPISWVASLKLRLATRRGDLAGVTEQASFLASPVTGQSDEEIALGNILRSAALMNLGTIQASAGLADAERHLLDGAILARKIGRPYLEVRCLAQLGAASRLRSFATTRRRCEEAIALAERHGWGTEGLIAPALVTLADTLVWTGEFDEAQRWLQRAALAMQADTGPDIRLLLHQATGILMAARGRHHEALEEFTAAAYLQSRLASPHVTASQVTGWMLATRARLGMTGEASAGLAALSDEQAAAGETGNARAALRLAEGDPAGSLDAVRDVLDAAAPVIGYVTVVEAHLLAGLAHQALGDQRAANQAVERALAMAETDRVVLPFAMTDSRQLLEALPAHETAHAALLADILDVLRGSSVTGEDSAWPVAELSASELRVLRYLPTNLSRHEIAGELSISVNTVSTHLRRIYGKLGVSDRTEAVDRARDLRLLTVGRPL